MTEVTLTTAHRRSLLEVARSAIRARLAGKKVPAFPELAELQARGGAFVSLHRRDNRELRGCVGFVEAGFGVVETVARAARAVCGDKRFPPVTLEEVPDLYVEISLLGALEPIAPEDVELGVHGLVLRHRGRSGLLLPQVPVELDWDRQTFLDHTCVKAGLPAGSWKDPDAELLGFTATVFGE